MPDTIIGAKMTPDDALLKEDVRRRLAGGFTAEMASAACSRFKLLQGFLLLGLVLNLASILGRRHSSTWGVIASALAVVASGSRRCGRCMSVMLPAEHECPRCGALTYPRLTLAFGIAFGLGMTVLALWRAGLFGE